MSRLLIPLFATLSACHGPGQIVVPSARSLSPPITSDAPQASPHERAEPVSCETAVKRVLAGHPALAAARAGERVEWSRADAVPRLGAFELRLRDEVEDLGEALRAGVRWRLPAPGRESALIAAAQERARMSAAEIITLESALARDVRTLHLAVRRARHTEVFAAHAAVLMATDAQWRQTRVKGGMETQLSAQTAMLEARTARRTLAAARRALAAAEASFVHQVGGPASDDVCAPTPDEDPAALHPAVRAALLRARAVGEDARAATAGGWLWPRFFEITWAREPDAADRAFLEVGIPLSFTGPARAAEGEAALAQAKARLQTAVDVTQREIVLAEADLAARIAERDVEPPDEAVAAARAVAERAEAFGGDPRQRLALRRALLREEARRGALAMAVEAARIRLRAARGRR